MKKIFYILIICVTIFLLFVVGIIGLFVYSMNVSDIEVEKNLKSVKWLPGTATDISYFEQSGFASMKIYECSIPKEDFMHLANKNDWELKNKKNVVLKYMSTLGSKINVDYSEPIGDALIYEERFRNGGGTTVVYDKVKNKLYYSYSHN